MSEFKRKAKRALLEEEREPEAFLSTGSTPLNMAISCFADKLGGIPTNCISELSGTGASGKTYICGEVAGDALRKGYLVTVDDIERRWVLSRLPTFGFSATTPNFKYYDDPSVEVDECFERIFRAADKLKRKQKLLYIVDPIAALYAKQELKSDKMSQARAKAFQKNFRFLKSRVSSTSGPNLTVIFSNQLIDNVGVMFGDKTTTPGGNALKHWPSIRIKFKAPGPIVEKTSALGKDVSRTVGILLHATIKKNSVDNPFREVDFSILYNYGINDVRDCLVWLKTNTNLIDDEDAPDKFFDSTYKWEDTSIRGLKKAIKFIQQNDLESRLQRLVRKSYRTLNTNVVLKPKYDTIL
jgi:recombination protein RecA